VVKTDLMCGNCGGGTFTVRHVTSQDAGRFGGGGETSGHVEVICTKCKSSTVIRAAPAHLEIDWGAHSKGILCGKS